jgi:hypothetical protein
MTARSEVVVVKGGDHSLQVNKRQLSADGQDQVDVDDKIFQEIVRFLATVSGVPAS